MGYFKKIYVGALDDEKEAALLYDKIALLVHGMKVRIFEVMKDRLKQIFLILKKK